MPKIDSTLLDSFPFVFKTWHSATIPQIIAANERTADKTNAIISIKNKVGIARRLAAPRTTLITASEVPCGSTRFAS